MATMQHRTWEKRFKPIKNMIDANASGDGTMFETYGKEEEYVRHVNSLAPATVWTLVDCDGGLRITNGYHFVNRIGYFITEVECPPDAQHDIKYL
jgi:hypothetical protein